MTDSPHSYVLTITCPDVIGIVAAVSGFLAARKAFITESSHYGDPDTDRFFMRTVFRAGRQDMPSVDRLRQDFREVAERFAMDWAIHDRDYRPRVVIAVSRFGHCLNDLLHRWQAGQLPIDVPAVISNHDTLRSLVEWYGIPYHHLPVTRDSRAEQEQRILDLMAETRADLLVLARYMQILSDGTCTALRGRCINIHHSFLPSFKGAQPYRQAHERGVKLIGATAHFATPELDEGPIIEQETARVDHTQTNEDFVAVGRDLENVVLARAVRWYCDHRVFLNGDKTVVFR